MEVGEGPRRVVTGDDGAGRSAIVRDDRPDARMLGEAAERRAICELWATVGAAPGGGASEFRIVELPAGCRRAMHRTESVDYGIVLAGEVYLVLEAGETHLRAGDVVVQRGTLHAWHNRSGAPARLAFVNLVGQVSDPERCPPL